MDSDLNFGIQLAKMAGGLALVMTALLGCVYGLKRTGRWLKHPESEAWMRILAQQTLGMKHQLVLLKVKDQTLLLGISPQGINLLTQLEGGTGGSNPPEAPPIEERA
jgi:flagellar biosynthetic protein FliO